MSCFMRKSILRRRINSQSFMFMSIPTFTVMDGACALAFENLLDQRIMHILTRLNLHRVV